MDLRAVLAHHEAGHVVADIVGGVGVGRVSVVHPVGGKTDVVGYTETDLAGLDADALRERLEPAVVGLLAGPFAEERYTGVYNGERAAADIHAAASLGTSCCPDGVDWATYENGLSGRARQIVNDRWSAISDLAAELADLGEMTGTQLDAFLARRLP